MGPDWVIWAVFGYIFFRLARGRRRRWRRWDRWSEGHQPRELERETPTPGLPRQSTAAPPVPAPPVRPKETPLQALQRDFVEGRISMDEYEWQLDRLERLD